MQFKTIIASCTGLLGLVSARIDSYAVPSTIRAGETFNAVLVGHDYIQSVAEIAAAFGIRSVDAYKGSLGTLLGSVYLGPRDSDTIGNLSFPLTVPSDTDKGEVSITTALYQLYGASSSPSIELLNVTVNVGDHTSEDYISTYHVEQESMRLW